MKTIKLKLLTRTLVVCGLFLAMLGSKASATVIDTFESEIAPPDVVPASPFFIKIQQAVNSFAPSSTKSQGPALSGVLGGYRTSVITHISGGGLTTLNISNPAPAGVLGFSNDTGTLGSFEISYGSLTGNAFAPEDLNGLYLSFNIVENDSGGTFTLVLDDGVSPLPDRTLSFGLGAAVTGLLQTDLSSISSTILSSVIGLSLSYTPAADGGDLSLGGPGLTFALPVPEPSSFVIMLTGIGLAGVFHRRRQKKQLAA